MRYIGAVGIPRQGDTATMLKLLILDVWILTLMNITAAGYTLGPGLSLKNLALYLVGFLIFMHLVLGGRFRFEIKAQATALTIIVLYGIASIAIPSSIMKVAGYDVVASAISLKSGPFDWLVYVVGAYCAARNFDQARLLLRHVLGAIGVANVLTMVSLTGIVHIGTDVVGMDNDYGVSRVWGYFGHPNSTGMLMVTILPFYFVEAESSRGPWRAAWVASGLATLALILMTGSRAALVALFASAVWSLWLLRRHISMATVTKYLGLLALGMIPILAVVGFAYWDMIVGRFADSDTVSAYGLTSGRSDFWMFALRRMAEKPWSFLVGFGWESFSVSGSVYAVHNHYLSLLYELGAIGMIAFIYFEVRTITDALRAVPIAAPEARAYMMALVSGLIACAIANIFGAYGQPWPYILLVVGAVLRMITLSRDAHAAAQSVLGRDRTKPRRSGSPVPGRGAPAW